MDICSVLVGTVKLFSKVMATFYVLISKNESSSVSIYSVYLVFLPLFHFSSSDCFVMASHCVFS